MELVDSVLAFALVMAALASVVTLLMEAFHRLFRLRAKGMEALLSQYYDEVLSSELKLSKDDKQKIMDRVLINPAKKIILDSSFRIFPDWLIKKLMRYTEVSTDDLLKRLNQAEVFSEIKGKAKIRKKLEKIEFQYNEYSAAMSDYFKRRAKLFSLLLGILLAFGANIDGLRVYEALKMNPEIRASIISQQANIKQKYKQAQQKLESVASDSTETLESNREEIKALKKSFEEATSGISELASLGLPIGWRYFPADANGSSGEITHDWFAYIAWVFKVLVTGLLIGLGAPFWFEIAAKLTRMKQGLKGKGAVAATEGEQTKPSENKTTIDKIIEST